MTGLYSHVPTLVGLLALEEDAQLHKVSRLALVYTATFLLWYSQRADNFGDGCSRGCGEAGADCLEAQARTPPLGQPSSACDDSSVAF